ncbi:protein of unknown function [Streptantibioticus cattleyicolor NRRL 8057 = DSM 46488]|nr:protein of unknown function [Streptantibioticus cattleyicolor NRRL 8057 = DSM 46488]
MISDGSGGLLVSASPGKDEVVQAGDAEHGVLDAVALQPAVAKDLPALHPGEDVLYTGADFAVGGVVLLLPFREFGLALLAAVRDDQAGAPVAAICDDRGLADGVFRAGQLPRLAVVAVACDWSADRDDEPGVGVDDDLVVGGVPVVLGLLGDGVVTGGNEGAVHDEHGVLAEPLALLERERGPEVVDDAVGRRLGHPEQRGQLTQGQVRPPVRGDQEHAVLQRQAPWPTLAHRVHTLTPERGDQLAELARAQPSERGYPGGLRRRDHTRHSKIISPVTSSYGTALRRVPSLQVTSTLRLFDQASDTPPRESARLEILHDCRPHHHGFTLRSPNRRPHANTPPAQTRPPTTHFSATVSAAHPVAYLPSTTEARPPHPTHHSMHSDQPPTTPALPIGRPTPPKAAPHSAEPPSTARPARECPVCGKRQGALPGLGLSLSTTQGLPRPVELRLFTTKPQPATIARPSYDYAPTDNQPLEPVKGLLRLSTHPAPTHIRVTVDANS